MQVVYGGFMFGYHLISWCQTLIWIDLCSTGCLNCCSTQWSWFRDSGDFPPQVALPQHSPTSVSAPMLRRPDVLSGAHISQKFGLVKTWTLLVWFSFLLHVKTKLPQGRICWPQIVKRRDLDSSLALTSDFNLMYGNCVFCQYHKGFCSKAALNISQSNTCLNWTLNCWAGGLKAASSTTRGSTGHSASLWSMFHFFSHEHGPCLNPAPAIISPTCVDLPRYSLHLQFHPWQNFCGAKTYWKSTLLLRYTSLLLHQNCLVILILCSLIIGWLGFPKGLM